MLNRITYENSRPGGISVLEIVDRAQPDGDQPRTGTEKLHQFVPLKRTELRGYVFGPLTSLRLTQIYGYSKDQCDKVLEVLYRFPLPGDAAVNGVVVRFGEVKIRTELKERQQAETEYKEAKRQGKQAALLTRESPQVFTLQVAGLQPDQDVTIETSYVQLAAVQATGWSLRIPLTTAPRYVRSDELTARHAQGQPLALLRDPGHRFSLDLVLREAASVESATHRLEVTREGEHLRVKLRDGEIIPDRDCVLSWQPSQQQDHPTLQVMLHKDRAAAQTYFLALAMPPSVRDPGRVAPREVILLVDHSGSMRGPKWQAADWAVKRFLSDLSPRDTLALGVFHSKTKWFSDQLVQASPDAINSAIRFLEERRDTGGTELGVALEQALSMKKSEGEQSRHVLILTDAQVTDEGRILRLASEEANRSDRRRTSLVCIDAAPNSFLALELAERGGGVAKFLTSDPQENDITTALDEVLADWAEPILTGLRLEVNREIAQAAGREIMQSDQAGWSAIDLGDLPAGRSLWVAGRIPAGDDAEPMFRLTTARKHEIAKSRPTLSEGEDQFPALKALFGSRRILGLEYLIHSGHTGRELSDQLERLGYDPEKVLAGRSVKPPKIYAENVRADAEAALRALLVKEALDYGLASSETAFIAVREEAGKPVETSVAVANALPAGWSDRFLSGGGVAFFAAGVPHMMKPIKSKAAKRPMLSSAPIDSLLSVSDVSSSALVEEVAKPEHKMKLLFSGTPQFSEGRAILFDTSQAEHAKGLPETTVFSELEIRFPAGAPSSETLDSEISLLLFVDDLAVPRAKVRLVDLIRQGLKRPLHLSKRAGEVVQIALIDPHGAWQSGAPEMEVRLGW